MTAEDLRACAGCCHCSFNPQHAQHVCEHPNVAMPSVVTGKTVGLDATACRNAQSLCGREGCWFEPKATVGSWEGKS